MAGDPRLSVLRGVELFELEERVVGLGQGGQSFALEGVDIGGLRAVLELADGTRTAAEIVSALSSEYDSDDVTDLLAQLVGPLLESHSASELAPRSVADLRIDIVGSGELADAIEKALAQAGASKIGRLSPQFKSCEMADFRALVARRRLVDRAPPTQAAAALAVSVADLASSFVGASLVLCALEGVHGQAVLDVNEAALAAQVPVLFVTVEADACVIGPLVLPARTACFVCSRLSTVLRPHYESGGYATLPLRFHRALPADAARWLPRRAAAEVVSEVERFATGMPYPERIGSLLMVAFSGGARTVDFRGVTACPACRGHHRGEVHEEAIRPKNPMFNRTSVHVCDQTGGSRTVSPEEATKRALRACETLGVELSCSPLPVAAPEKLHSIACPFFRTHQVARFSVARPIIFPRFTEPNFGKGTTEIQARCSGTFEWLERNLADWQGDRDLVRASYRDVASDAIDLPFFASALLPGVPVDPANVFDDRQVIDWVWGHCLKSDRPILLPAASVFFDGLFFGSSLDLPVRGSSGLSAGCSVPDALLQGLLEIVERDATHTATRNGLVCPIIDIESIADPAARELISRLVSVGYRPFIRDVTSSIRIPAIEVTLVDDGDYANHHAWGSGAHPDPHVALRRALTEAVQVLFGSVGLAAVNPLHGVTSLFDTFPRRKMTIERVQGVRSIQDMARVETRGEGVWSQIDAVVECIRAGVPNGDVCAVDLSHPALDGIHVVRSFVSGVMDEVGQFQTHIPERCRLVPATDMYLGRME